MNKKLKTLIITTCIITLAGIFGACSVQEIITPCFIPQEIIDSVNVNVPIISWWPWTSLFDAYYVKTKLDFQYLLHSNLMETSIHTSEVFRQNLFSPTGLISAVIPASLAGILGIFGGGRFVKSPREKELEKKVNGE